MSCATIVMDAAANNLMTCLSCTNSENGILVKACEDVFDFLQFPVLLQVHSTISPPMTMLLCSWAMSSLNDFTFECRFSVEFTPAVRGLLHPLFELSFGEPLDFVQHLLFVFAFSVLVAESFAYPTNRTKLVPIYPDAPTRELIGRQRSEKLWIARTAAKEASLFSFPCQVFRQNASETGWLGKN